ncbi:hypothetical protein GQ55_1G374800 [Panicum hallii var. hallii]|uniref:Uncharacterized protein n=1 Tax=Panicum hallii var. hallii TaxID=1504633 RepID=A0A2T7FBN3_9POAL|nr:hypothetical protein GQ55_1G374800 [Panicum hallii var. hallii]
MGKTLHGGVLLDALAAGGRAHPVSGPTSKTTRPAHDRGFVARVSSQVVSPHPSADFSSELLMNRSSTSCLATILPSA